MSDEMRIEYVALDEVRRWPRNPKLHDAPALDGSIGRFGYCDPVTIDEGTGHLVEGHGRVEALSRLRLAGKPAPDRVKVDDAGHWLVPVVRGVRFKDEMEAEAYLLAHNRISETGGWDNHALVEILEAARGVSLEGVGWSSEEVDKILEKYAPKDPADVEFPEYDESAAAGVIVHECPKCGHKFA
jgi:hypothetical protein